MVPRPRDVLTSVGVARVHRRGPRVAPTLVLGHGAGGGIEAGDLQVVAQAVTGAGFGVVLVEQPWRVAGKRVAAAPSTLDVAWTDVVSALRLPGALIFGGRSAGARVACRTADRLGAAGVVCLAFPLHPPGRPERSRAVEITSVACPVLVVQGTRDAFGTAEEVEAAAPGLTVHPVEGADHALRLGGDVEATRVAREAAAARIVAFLGAIPHS